MTVDPDAMDLETYRALLSRTAAAYPTRGFDVLAEPDLPARFCILRHDIDMSASAALEMAEAEAEMGITTTYMVLLTGPQYSPFEKPTLERLRRIADLGHEIGLHFDAAWHGIDEEASLDLAVAHEAQILGRLLGRGEIRCFSFHNTTPFTMSARKDRYGGLWNAYSGRLQEQLEYVSDSNGYWRFRTWDELLGLAPSRLQVLTHPEWWTGRPGSPAEKICRILDRRAQTGWTDYVAVLSQNGRSINTSLPARIEERLLASAEGRRTVLHWLSGEREAAYLMIVRALAQAGTPVARECRQMALDLIGGENVGADALMASFVAAAQTWADSTAHGGPE